MNIKDFKERIPQVIFENTDELISGGDHQKLILDGVDLFESELNKSESGLTEEISKKADKTYVNTELGKKVDNTKFDSYKKEQELLNDSKVDKESYKQDLEELKQSQTYTDQEQDKRIDNNSIKISESNQELKVIKDTLKHLGSNNEIEVANGGGVVNLPNNAMRSVAPRYKFEGLTLNQLVKNGDFKNGTEGWAGVGGGSINNAVVENCIITFMPANKYSEIALQLRDNIKANHKLYFRGMIKSKSNGAVIVLSDNKQTIIRRHSGSGEFELLSNIIEIDSESVGGFIGIRENDEREFVDISATNIMAFDLTSIFGAGNEPSKEWCDEHIQGYFEGVKSVQTPMRVKSVGENLLYNGNGEFGLDGWVALNNATEIKNLEGGGFSYKRTSSGIADGVRTLIYLPKGEYWIRARSKGQSAGASQDYILVNFSEGGWKRILQTSHTGVGVEKFSIDKSGYYWLRNENLGGVNSIQKFGEVSITKNKPSAYIDSLKPSLYYINNQLELKSVGTTKDYIENGKLYKNVSDDGEILKKTEVVNLSTSGLIEANPNGTVFFEPITNLTGFYDNGLDVEGLNILEVEEFSHLVNGVYQNLDVSKVKIEGGKLTHPDAQNGLVYLVYRYDDNPVYGESTISYYNNNRVLESPNGTFFKPVFNVDDEGNITMKGEKL